MTAGGEFSEIGLLESAEVRGLGFNGGKLYAGDKSMDQLYELSYTLDPAFVSIDSRATVTLAVLNRTSSVPRFWRYLPSHLLPGNFVRHL